MKTHPCRTRVDGIAAQMVTNGWIDRCDRLEVARLIEDVLQRDRASRDDAKEEDTLP